ncbi:MAG: ATP-binding protein [Actinomycetota bacterium]
MEDWLHREGALRNPWVARAKEAEPANEAARDAGNGRAPTVRVAVYDSLASLPRVVELTADGARDFVDLMANKTYELSQAKGGEIPFTVIREVVENLVHAYFEEAVITILDNGNTIRVSDQGPGIENKAAVFVPGFSTATREMKQVIRGVGSGLPVAKEILEVAGGKITVEDNLEKGAVITLSLDRQPAEEPAQGPAAPPDISLTDRQKKILFLVTELGSLGPSKVAQELDASVSSAYRDLVALEGIGLIGPSQNGQRSLTPTGVAYLERMEG